VGDRWTLLILRELAARPCRFRDLADGLPGIAANLLTDRLRVLTAEGVIARDDATAAYSLTERGKGLGPALKALARWGIPLMARGQDGDECRVHWLALAVSTIFAGKAVRRPVRIQIIAGSGEIEIVAHSGGVETRSGRVISADATLEGPDELILGALSGGISLAAAEQAGLSVIGSRPALDRLIAVGR
jgi:DNA-binding HxlR family transcriptional regulator